MDGSKMTTVVVGKEQFDRNRRVVLRCTGCGVAAQSGMNAIEVLVSKRKMQNSESALPKTYVQKCGVCDSLKTYFIDIDTA